MWDDLKSAAREGVLLGVKWAIIAAFVVFAVSMLLGDYIIVRQRAANGQQAFEFIVQQQQRVQQQQQQLQPVSPPANPAEPDPEPEPESKPESPPER